MREVRAIFSTTGTPSRGKSAFFEDWGYPPPRETRPEISLDEMASSPPESVSPSPAAPDDDGHFDESLEARLRRRYGSTTREQWHW
jgi:hypothetical protein